MGTCALIGVMDKQTKQISYAYVGYEGMPDYTGKLLKEKYNTARMAKKLVALSDFRMLHPTIKKTEQDVYKDTRYWEPVFVNEFIKEGRTVDYLYLFLDGAWCVKAYRDKEFKPI